MDKTSPKTTPSLLRLIAAFCTLEIALLFLLQILYQQAIYPVNIFGKLEGIDYYDPFYIGSLLLNADMSPYLHERYTSPPLFALLNTPFLSFRSQTMSYVLSGASFIIVALGTIWAFRLFHGRDIDYVKISANILIIMAFSFPFLFLFDRSNIDALVFGCVLLGIFLMTSSEIMAGACFATAVSLKIYPVILLAPLFILRKKTIIASFAFCSAAYFLLQKNHWITYITILKQRSTIFENHENASMATAMHYFGEIINSISHLGIPFEVILRKNYLLIYIPLFLITLFFDLYSNNKNKIDQQALIFTYFPFMVAAPKLVYNYELIFLLPLIPLTTWLAQDVADAPRRRLLTATALLLALTQFQTVAFFKLTGFNMLHAVPSVALLLLIILFAYFKYRAARARTSLKTSLTGHKKPSPPDLAVLITH
jgi:hypothetical protein